MIKSIRTSIENAFIEYPTIKRTLWVQKWPGQSVLCVSQIFWTTEVHEVLNVKKPDQMRNYHTFLTVFLGSFNTNILFLIPELFQNQLNDIVDLVRSKLSKQTRISLSALVTLDVHGRDVVDDLAKNNVTHHMDFKWLSQLRYCIQLEFLFLIITTIFFVQILLGKRYLSSYY